MFFAHRESQSLAKAASSPTGALPVDSPFTAVASGLLDSEAIPAAARTACLRKERRFMGSVLDLREGQSLAKAASSPTGALPVDSPFTAVASGLLDSEAIPAAARTACLRKERRFMGSVLD